MARMPRVKNHGEAGWYHLYARAAGVEGEYPLESPECRRKLASIIERFTRVYQCCMAAFCIMGDHWHTVIHFAAARLLEGDELVKLAEAFYPGSAGKKLLAGWLEADWARFARRIFDVSEFMRNVQSEFASWYNRTHNRKGRFWGDRFGSVILEDERSVLDCMLYVELNPVRAGIAELPEDHRASSCHLRAIGEDDWLVDVGEILEAANEKAARKEYRSLLLWRGTEPTREGQASIPRSVVRREEKRGYRVRGAYAKRLAYLTEGLVLGSREFVSLHLKKMMDLGYYLRRREPVEVAGSPYCVLRPQRNC
jgi:hypothetical protein